MIRPRILCLCILLTSICNIVPPQATSQNLYPLHKHWESSLALGVTNFYGDLSDKKNNFTYNTPFSKFYYRNRELVFEYGLTKHMNPYWSLRGNLLYGHLSGSSDLARQYFEADLLEYHLTARANLSNIILGQDLYRKHSFYFMAGIGFTNWNVLRYSLQSNEVLGGNGFFKKGRGGYILTTTETVIPFGIGYSFALNDRWKFHADARIHGINTDKLDDYISDEMRVEGYGSMMVGISYAFDIKSIQIHTSRPKFTGRSNEPALKAYNKQKKVVMTTPQHKKAVKKRYKTRKSSYRSIFNLSGKRKIKFAK